MWRLIPLVFLACSAPNTDRIVDYLKGNWDLKKRITDRKELNDSLKLLDERFGWDLDSVKSIVGTWQDAEDFERLFNKLKEQR